MLEQQLNQSLNPLDAIVVLRNRKRDSTIEEGEHVRRFRGVLGPLDSGVGFGGIKRSDEADEEGAKIAGAVSVVELDTVEL
jgi:hypothetical protein